MLYVADIEFQTFDDKAVGQARRLTLHFEADGGVMKGLDRWWKNRHESVPEHFNRICSVKVFRFIPQRIDAAGRLPPDTGMPCLEWKCDVNGAEGWFK
jgi:hypothetical protein